MLSQDHIRSAFIDFFSERGCKVFPSSSLIPDDPSLLLANAGMNQFKQYYLGTKTMDACGAVSVQKCIRTNDIDVIGRDGRHLSFFEMLGNFSFGGYDKRQACTWALEFVTRVLKIPADNLYFTVFLEDDEAEQIWQDLGVDSSHISRLGEDDNFWAAGPTGPCGPCSEIYVDLGPEVGCGSPDCAPGCDCDRFMEIWNLVFTQYDRQEDGTLKDLAHQNIDTGMGLERVSAVVKHKASSYECDALHSLVELAESLSGKRYGEASDQDASIRIVADHARAVTFMLADGILPSNEGRGYILRRLLRRAAYHGRLLGIKGPFLACCAQEVIRLMSSTYPELSEHTSLVVRTIEVEEERFVTTLETGERTLQESLDKLEEGQDLPGDIAFMLHDTYGFPLELTQELASMQDHGVDTKRFLALMNEQKERARKASATEADAWSNVDIWTELSQELELADFVGYTLLEVPDARVLALVDERGKRLEVAQAGQNVQIVLSSTPFYAEMGGQVGDSGTLRSMTDDQANKRDDNTLVSIDDTTSKSGIVIHHGKVLEGMLGVGQVVSAQVDAKRRSLIARNHTATHLLDAALRQVLGVHVNQAGSLVTDTHLRFDFTHFEALSEEELQRIEDLVNEKIIEALPVRTEIMSLQDAKASGAIALFGEKYADTVRVLSIGDEQVFSCELCGGTHASNTSELGIFKITSESSVGAAQRRIEAVTSSGALNYVNERLGMLKNVAYSLKTNQLNVHEALTRLLKRQQELKNQLKSAAQNAGVVGVERALAAALECNGYKLVLSRVHKKSAAELRDMWDKLKSSTKEPLAALLVATTEDSKAVILAAATKEAVAAGFNAGEIIKKITSKLGGKGGGNPQMAQGGIPDASIADGIERIAREELGTS